MSACEKCTFGKQPAISYSGDRSATIAFIGQSPGKEEMQIGVPFVGPSGQLLKRILAECGVDERDALFDNAMRCPPPDGDDHDFTHEEIIQCARSHLWPTLNQVRPKVIVALGNEAWVALHHREPLTGVELGAGQMLPWNGFAQSFRCFHPSAAMRQPDYFGVFKSCIHRAVDYWRGDWRPMEPPRVIGTVIDPDKIERLLNDLLAYPHPITFDIETHGATKAIALDEYRGELVGIAFSDGVHSFFVPINHRQLPESYTRKLPKITEQMRRVLVECDLIGHNAWSFDSRWCIRHLDCRPNVVHDTMAMHHLWDEAVPHKLEYVARWVIGAQDWKGALDDALDQAKKDGLEPGNKNVDLELLGEYASRDAHYTHATFSTMWHDPYFLSFKEHGPIRLYSDLVQPLGRVLRDMELAGIKVDQDALEPTHEALTNAVSDLDRHINEMEVDGIRIGDRWYPKHYECLKSRVEDATEKHDDWGIQWDGLGLPSVADDKKAAVNWRDKTAEYMEDMSHSKYCGRGVNPGSDAQMRWLLYDALGLECEGLEKTPKSGISVNKANIKILRAIWKDGPQAEILRLFSERVRIAKLDSTYVKGLIKHGLIRDDGRVHPHYGYDTETESAPTTGRLSCSAPNLQNQPKSMRPLYVPEDGWVFIEADYSQMEMRCLAHCSQDDVLIQALEEEDVHRGVAAWIFETPYDEVSDEQRRQGKQLNFAIAYGMGPDALAASLETTKEHAEELIRQYFARLPKVKAWVESQHRLVQQTGLVYNEMGRVRRIPGAKYLDKGALGYCLRQAANMPIQGLAADICNRALVRMHGSIPNHGKWWRMVNTVHDQVLAEVRREWAADVAQQIERVMTEPPFPSFSVPLKVDLEITERWGGELNVQKIIEGVDDEG